jgi:hypothetical protein
VKGGTQKLAAAGLALVALYLGTVALTGLLSRREVRPLFDGPITCARYQWISPPPQFADGNTKPLPKSIDVPLSSTRGVPLGLQSSEEVPQLVVSLPAGAIPPDAGATTLHVQISPLDPASLGPLPPDARLRADGNAYRVELSYEPSGQAVNTITRPGNVFLSAPDPAHRIAFSPEGSSWQLLDAVQVRDRCSVAGVFRQPGIYLVAAPLVPPTHGPGSGGTGSGTVLAVGGVALLALILVATPLVLRRARGRGSPAG